MLPPTSSSNYQHSTYQVNPSTAVHSRYRSCYILSSVMPPHWYKHWCLKILKAFESYAAKYFLLQLSTKCPIGFSVSRGECGQTFIKPLNSSKCCYISTMILEKATFSALPWYMQDKHTARKRQATEKIHPL